jgi:methylmalonyl-CoA mutase N-terminal domain/subunit
VEQGVIQSWIADRAYDEQLRLESGERVVVGVNRYRRADPPRQTEFYEVDPGELAAQIDRVRRIRGERDAAAAENALAALRTAALGTENLMPRLIDCSLAYCTMGEMISVLREVFGVFHEPVVV